MMTTTLRIVLILVSVVTFLLMMRKIRQSKIQIESAIFWIVLSLVLVVFSLFPPIADFIAHCLGIYSTPNFLFLFAIFLLIVKEFRMTIHISQLETRIKELVQRMALEEKLKEEHGAGVSGEQGWGAAGPDKEGQGSPMSAENGHMAVPGKKEYDGRYAGGKHEGKE